MMRLLSQRFTLAQKLRRIVNTILLSGGEGGHDGNVALVVEGRAPARPGHCTFKSPPSWLSF